MLKRNLLALVAIAALGISAAGAVATADAHPAPRDGLNRPASKVEPFDRQFQLRDTDSPRMHRAWHAWKSLEQKRYATIVQRSCFCLPREAVITKVASSGITSVTRKDDPGRIIPRAGWTMDRFFFVLRHAYATADDVRVKFGANGVPRWIAIDKDTMMADEEVYYSVTLQRPVPAIR